METIPKENADKRIVTLLKELVIQPGLKVSFKTWAELKKSA